MLAKVVRTYAKGKATMGRLFLYDDKGKLVFSCDTLELPNKGNQNYVSCIPEGKYTVTPRYTETHGHHFEVQNVKGRDKILIHIGNSVKDILGCILVGIKLKDKLYVANSRVTMEKLVKIAPNGFELEIISANTGERGIEPIISVIEIAAKLAPAVFGLFSKLVEGGKAKTRDKAIKGIIFDANLSDEEKVRLTKYLYEQAQ